MIYFLLEINGLKQLKHIENEKTDAVLGAIFRILGAKDYNLIFLENDYLFLSMVFKEIRKDRIIDSIYRCYEFLNKQDVFLQGFSLLADFQEGKADNIVYQYLKGQLYQTSRSGSLFITEKMNNIFRAYFIVEKDAGLFKVVGRKEYFDPLFSRGGALQQREDIKQLFIEKLVEFSQNEHKSGWIINVGAGKNSCFKENLERALKDISGHEEPDWVWCDCNNADNESCVPFAEYFNLRDLTEYKDFLSPVEIAILDKKSDFSSNADHVREDLFIKISLYLKSYVLFCESKFLPAFMIFENIDRLKQLDLDFIKKIFISLEYAAPILITPEDKAPEIFRDFSIIDIPVPEMSIEELVSKLPQLEDDDFAIEEIIAICERHPDYLFYFSFLKKKGFSLHTVKAKEDITRLLMRTFEYIVQKIFYVLCLVKTFYSIDSAIGFLRALKIEDELIDSAIDELISLNLLQINKKRITIEKEESYGFLEHILKNDINSIREKLMEHLLLKNEEFLFSKNGLIDLLIDSLEYDKALDLILPAIMYRLDRNELDYALEAIDKCSRIYSRKQRENNKLGEIISFLRLRSALIDGNEITSAGVFSSLPGEAYNQLENLILQGKYHNAVKNYRTAMVCLKSLLMKVEESEQPEIVGEAYLNLGLSFLGLRKLEEAKEYFSIAQEHSMRFKLTYQYIRSLIMHSVSLLFIGNYSGALRLLEDAAREGDAAGCRNWETLAVFLRGRTFFELGEYEKARVEFQRAMTLALLYNHKKGMPVYYRWLARSFAYDSKYSTAEEILNVLEETPEGDFFLAETYYFLGKNREARELMQKRNLKYKAETFRPAEQIVYKTGFSMVEDLALSGTDGECVLSYLQRSFLTFLIGLTGSANEAAAELFSITREDRLADCDPNIHLYYLFYTLIAPETGETQILDRITLLSKGLKILQERASEIDSPQDRRSYLTKNRWNDILLGEARKYKLI